MKNCYTNSMMSEFAEAVIREEQDFIRENGYRPKPQDLSPLPLPHLTDGYRFSSGIKFVQEMEKVASRPSK